VPIEGGDYPLGSDEGLYQDEAPAHTVILAPYAIGRFPVTNAEWQCFLEPAATRTNAGGTPRPACAGGGAGLRRRARSSDGGTDADSSRATRIVGKALAEARITSKHAEDYESYRTMADAEFEALLDSW
jgi:formylglycine-generating enzyme required for sulfatase activity